LTLKFDVLVLGAGAAGLFCAAEAAKRGRRVAILERADRVGKKILISGGGRCNFTNLYCSPDNFLSDNPHFAKSALAGFTPADFIARVERHGIPYHEKTLGQLFCDRAATDITGILESECHAAGVKMFLNVAIRDVSQSTEFHVRSESGGKLQEFTAPAVIVATGGLSIPKMGATSFGYELAKKFGLKTVPTRPALVPLLFSRVDLRHYSELAGVSAEVIASLGNAALGAPAFREKMLFTHRGLSGPAILQISSYWNERNPIEIDLAPGLEVTAPLRESTSRNEAALRKRLQTFLSKRLATQWLEAHLPASWNNAGLAEFEKLIHAWRITPAGTEGYEKAEVTVGGVDTNALSSKTMEARHVPGLFFIGEVVDVTGHLGGFNFQWAWASAYAAAQAV
jgi:predicted Rossmann fold flavoprotein